MGVDFSLRAHHQRHVEGGYAAIHGRTVFFEDVLLQGFGNGQFSAVVAKELFKI